MNEVIITKNNFATLLNLGKISKEALGYFNTKIGNYSKEISEMTIRESQSQEDLKNIRTASEIMGIGSDIAKVVINKANNEALTQEISFKYTEDVSVLKNKEKFNEIIEKNNIINTLDGSDFLRSEIRDIVISNEELIRENGIFTKEELKKILYASDNNLPEMFDYKIFSGGNHEDMLKDVNILNKCSSCTLKDSNGKYIFSDFLIIDGNGVAVDPKLINKSTKKFLLNFGLQEDIGEKNLKALQILSLKTEITDKVAKISKLRGNANLVKVIKRMSGTDELRKEFSQYTQSLSTVNNIVRVASKVEKVAEKGVEVGYKGIKMASVAPLDASYKKAKREKDFKNAVKLKKRLNTKNANFTKFEKGVSAVRHPFRSLTNKLSNSVKSTRIAKNISERASKSVVSKVYRGLNSVISAPFKLIANAFNPIKNIISSILIATKAILVKTLILFAPLIIFLLIIFAIFTGLGGGVAATTGAVAIMPLADQEDFDLYQLHYDTLDDDFLMSLEGYLANNATKLNLKGEKIKYGINGQNNESGMENSDFNNGMYYRFITDSEHEGRSSNIEDLIAIMAIVMSQSQSDYKEIALKLMEWLYDISHSYTFTESPLYACDSGCHNIHYECNDHYHDYSDTDIKYNPFHALKKNGGDYEILKAEKKCVVCEQVHIEGKNNTDCEIYLNDEATKEDYYGCVSHANCYHGEDHNIGRNRNNPYECNNYEAYYECPGHEVSDGDGGTDTEYCDGPLGCEGYYVCEGHPHYVCEGHEFKCCLGHVDIQMNVQIKFFNELKDIINGYNFGTGDILYNELSSKQG